MVLDISFFSHKIIGYLLTAKKNVKAKPFFVLNKKPSFLVNPEIWGSTWRLIVPLHLAQSGHGLSKLLRFGAHPSAEDPRVFGTAGTQ